MNFTSALLFTIVSAFIVHLSINVVQGQKHKLLVQVPTHVKQHVHTVYKIVKVPVFVKESTGRNARNGDHEHPHKVQHSGKFEHQHLHKHLHEHREGPKTDPLHHHHRHSVDGRIVVDHKHRGTITHHHKGRVGHDNAGVVKHFHDGNVENKHLGRIGHYHGGTVRHKHSGSVGHYHDGDVEHKHVGEVGHEHAGHVGHGHKGLIGHIHSGNVGHDHDGKVEHDHSGNVAHGHGGYVDHDHNGNTSHIHAGDIVHDQPEIVDEDHSDSYQELSGSEAPDEPDEKQPIVKAGFYDYAIGLPVQADGRSFLHGSNLILASAAGTDGITANAGKPIGERQSHWHADEAEDETANEPEEKAGIPFVQKEPQYEVFEDVGFQ